jgi:hypothetical protein
VLARKSERTSSSASYDSSSGAGDWFAGREEAGRVYAGPRTFVRRGRRGKLPIMVVDSGGESLKILFYCLGVVLAWGNLREVVGKLG